MDFRDQLAELESLVHLELMAFLSIPVLQKLSVQMTRRSRWCPRP